MNDQKTKTSFTDDLYVVYDYFYNDMFLLIDNVEAIFEKYDLPTAVIRILAYMYRSRIDRLQKECDSEKIRLSGYDYKTAWTEMIAVGLGYEAGDNYHIYKTALSWMFNF